MKINDTYIKDLINRELSTNKDDFSEEELKKIEMLNIEKKFDFSELINLINIKELKFYDMHLAVDELAIISKLNSLENLYFLNCEIDSLNVLSTLELDTFYLESTEVDNIKYINNMSIKNLFLEKMFSVDLNDISIIRNVVSLSLNNTKVLNEDKMIYMDKIVNLSIVNTGIKNIDTLIGSDTLKTIVIDRDIYKNNVVVVKKLMSNGVSVVSETNQVIDGELL